VKKGTQSKREQKRNPSPLRGKGVSMKPAENKKPIPIIIRRKKEILRKGGASKGKRRRHVL